MESMLRHVNSYINRLGESVPRKVIKLEDIKIFTTGYKENNDFPEISAMKPYEWGSPWGGGIDSHAWFYIPVDVPEDMRGDDTLELCLHTDRTGWDADNPQFLCFVDGVMRQAFDTNHRELVLGASKTRYEVWIYAYTGPRIEHSCIMPYLRTVNDDVRQLIYDVSVPRNALECLGTNTVEYMEILTHLSMALRKVNMLEPRGEEFHKSVAEARQYLKETIYSPKHESETAVICIGHTHIDIAWLWTVAQTREKAQRSFATVIELMKRFPEYKFMSSQAYLYKAVKEEAPELYEEIKKMVKAGRWEVEGAMWVEADCNLASGESLVRQVLYGRNFFREEFGVESRVLWLPDVFGYSAALPQILRKSGVEWFVTSKISWNDRNVMPYDLFKWIGVDGTPINAYFLTAQDKGRTDAFTKGTTYVGNTNPRMIAGSYNRFQQKELARESIVTFGYGDGGGGPNEEMLQIARR
ncbi:MAG: alpha-mannosidase, partial [Clostridia bacterium]|nr:alpha-mannosidase [Clostridia bacterium]